MEHKCFLCGVISENVNHIMRRHVGGQGDVEFPICDNAERCIARQNEANKEWHQAMGIKEAH